MTYEKLGLQDGTVLTAEHLNHIEDGISKCPQAWTEVGEMVEILPETQLLFIEDMGGFGITQELSLAVGETYLVTYNGVGYRTVAQEQIDENMGATIVLGNFGAATGGKDTGEPFVVVYAPNVFGDMGMSSFLMAIDGATSVTIAISGRESIIHRLDRKYLPETIELKVNDDFTISCKYSPSELFELINNRSDLVDFAFKTKNVYYRSLSIMRNVTLTVDGDRVDSHGILFQSISTNGDNIAFESVTQFIIVTNTSIKLQL